MRLFAVLGSAALAASVAVAAPLHKKALTDTDILQFALFLEHLENAFYKQAISTIPYDSFIGAGFSPQYYQNLLYIASDEQAHVEALTAALSEAGATPNEACTYSFPFTDPYSFVGLSSILEGVGVAAYLGAAPAIQEPAYLAVAGAILVTEAIHQSLTRFNLGAIAPGDPYGTALGANEVFTMASAFATSCPPSAANLPFTAFPALTPAQTGFTSGGAYYTFSTEAAIPDGAFITWVSGLNTISVVPTINGQYITAEVPTVIGGQSYAILTSSNTTTISDDLVVAGPTVVEVTSPPPAIDFSVLKT